MSSSTSRHRARRIGLLAAAAGLVAGASIIPVSTASAATTVDTLDISLTGSTGSQDFFSTGEAGLCDICAPDDLTPQAGVSAFGIYVDIDADATFNQPAQVLVARDDALLEEGSVLDTEATLLMQPSTIDVAVGITGGIGLYHDENQDGDWEEDIAFGTIGIDKTIEASAPCTLPISGTTTCSVEFGAIPTLPIVSLFGDVLFIGIETQLSVNVTVDSSGVVASRVVSVNGGDVVADGLLPFAGSNPATVADPQTIPCHAAGKTVEYGLDGLGYSPEVDMALNADLAFKFEVVGVDLIDWSIIDFDLFEASAGNVTLDSTGDSVELGSVLADQDAPVADAGGAYGGTEGSAVVFDGSASTDDCGAPSLTWTFSDGGVAYGTNPSHVFADNGTYSGQLKAVDARGNVDYDTFTVSITNVAPNASQTNPGMTVKWGQPVAFQGSAVDPGAADQATLQGSWNFADGNTATGFNQVHTYSAPGTYHANFTARDKDGAWSNVATRTVTVQQRATSVAYNGAVLGLPKKASTLKANVVDELGQPVFGRTVTFKVGTQTVTAVTDAGGTATATLVINQKTGTYTVSATFAGDAKYGASTVSTSYRIGK